MTQIIRPVACYLVFPLLVVTALAAQQFLSPATFAVGNTPTHVAVGDFNGDGKLDLAVSNYVGISVSVLLGNGDGTFRPQVQYATAGAAEGIAIGDFNGDGKLDLAVANDSEDLSILIGNGDGTFQQSVSYPAGSEEIAICAADFNKDGKLDLLVGTRTGGLTVLLGSGDGTFKGLPSMSYGSGIYGCAIGDFNGDGKADAVVPDINGTNLYVLLGNGDGTFLPAVPYNTGNEAVGVAVADLNGDGKLDLVKADYSAGASVLLGNEDGTFQSPQSYNAGSSPYAVAVNDFNGDGKLDIIVTELQSNTVSLLLGNGDGTFGAPVEYAAGANPIAVAVGDFNGDGSPDLAVVTEGGTNTVSVVLNAGPKTGVPIASISPATLTFPVQSLNKFSPSQSVTISNVGTGTLEINSIALTGNGHFPFANGCGATLAVGATCTVQLSFRPTLRGLSSAALSIADDTTVSPQTVALIGTGDALGLSATSLNFGRVALGSSKSQPLTLANAGREPIVIGTLKILGMNSGDYSQTNNCGSAIAAHASCTVSVTFAPGSTGSSNAHIQFASNGTGLSVVSTIPLTGIGQ